ncbi:MAG: hypothetical protein QG623_694 [Patescibacteria group bacterium]|nr:hypothetical protein [Patescibacteria group bacterium]
MNTHKIRDTKIKSKSNGRRKKPYFTRLALVLLIVAVQLLGLIPRQSTEAAATPTKMARYEALRALTERGPCNRTSDGTTNFIFQEELSGEEFGNPDRSPLETNYVGQKVNVSPVLFPESGGQITCARALFWYYDGAYTGESSPKKREAFLKDYYEISNGDPYPIKLDSSGRVKTLELWGKVRSYMFSLVGNDSSEFEMWTDRIISYAFNKCFKWGPTDTANVPVDIKEATTEQKKDPDNWVYEDKNTPFNGVGWAGELEIVGEYKDGAVSCDETKSYIFPDHTDLIGFSDEDLIKDLTDARKAAAAAELGGQWINSQDAKNVLLVCAADAGLNFTNGINVYEVATWFVYNDEDHILNTTPPPTQAQLNKFKLCIAENAPGAAEVLEELDQDIAQIKADVEAAAAAAAAGSGGNTPEEDLCLASNDFVSWFVCPILDLVDTVLTKLKEWIDSWLVFSLDEQNVDDGLKNAWNIFRSLATIIIMAGFLLALLVKGVKGE